MTQRLRSQRWRRPVLTLAFLILSRLCQPPRAGAEDRVEYRYEEYIEDHNRMHVRTHALGFDLDLASKITAHGLLVYDGISGATPTGELPPLGSQHLPLARVADIRRAATLGPGFRYGRHASRPEFTYSEEADYISRGLALTHTTDFNERNTTLVAAAAQNFDSVGGGVLAEFQRKRTTDLLLGLNQLLGPTRVLSINVTLGYADGYLNDPYRLTTFLLPDSPDPIFSDPAAINPVPEARPGHRFRQTGYASFTQAVKPLQASLEATYRLSHDDWGVWANTVSLTWFQKLGRHVTVAPTFRYHWQSGADFYRASFRGLSFQEYAGGTEVYFEDGFFAGFAGESGLPEPGAAGVLVVTAPSRPSHYSSDYRLSHLEAFTLGVAARIQVGEHVTLDLAYKRYEMRGLDHATPGAAYPSANVFTVGCGLWF